jgi:hypothetical protein
MSFARAEIATSLHFAQLLAMTKVPWKTALNEETACCRDRL